jgi:hypothetical protein
MLKSLENEIVETKRNINDTTNGHINHNLVQGDSEIHE